MSGASLEWHDDRPLAPRTVAIDDQTGASGCSPHLTGRGSGRSGQAECQKLEFRAVSDETQVESSIGNTDYCELTRRARRLYSRVQPQDRFRPERLGGAAVSSFVPATSVPIGDDACQSCSSRRQRELAGEICLHFPGRTGKSGQAAGLGVPEGRRLLGLRLGAIQHSRA